MGNECKMALWSCVSTTLDKSGAIIWPKMHVMFEDSVSNMLVSVCYLEVTVNENYLIVKLF